MLWKIYRWLSPGPGDEGGGVGEGVMDTGAGDGAGGDLPPDEPGLEDDARLDDPGKDEGDPAAKKVPGWQKRINELTRRSKEGEERFNELMSRHQAVEALNYQLLEKLQQIADAPPAAARQMREDLNDLPPVLKKAIQENPRAQEALDVIMAAIDHKLGPISKNLQAMQAQREEMERNQSFERESAGYQMRMAPIITRVVDQVAGEFKDDPLAERMIALSLGEMNNGLLVDRGWNALPDQLKWQRFEQEVGRCVTSAVALLKDRDTGLLKRGSHKTTAASKAVPAGSKVPGGAAPISDEKEQEIMRKLRKRELSPSEASAELVKLEMLRQRGEG